MGARAQRYRERDVGGADSCSERIAMAPSTAPIPAATIASKSMVLSAQPVPSATRIIAPNENADPAATSKVIPSQRRVMTTAASTPIASHTIISKHRITMNSYAFIVPSHFDTQHCKIRCGVT